jgi:hypothetical protein
LLVETDPRRGDPDFDLRIPVKCRDIKCSAIRARFCIVLMPVSATPRVPDSSVY